MQGLVILAVGAFVLVSLRTRIVVRLYIRVPGAVVNIPFSNPTRILPYRSPKS